MSRHPSELTPIRMGTHAIDAGSLYLCNGCGEAIRQYVYRYTAGNENGLVVEQHLIENVYTSGAAAEFLLCSACGDAIANLYNKHYGGRWLTWENPPREPARRNRFKISPGKRRQVYERDAYRCRYCGGHEQLGVDHIIPITREGCTNELENLVTCCKSCNSKKGPRTPKEAGMAIRLPGGGLK